MDDLEYTAGFEQEFKQLQMLSWRTLARARTHMDLSDLPRDYWEELLSKLKYDQTPYEAMERSTT